MFQFDNTRSDKYDTNTEMQEGSDYRRLKSFV